ncbi:MAG TPA: molecular chaperone DnaK [Myxococcaceae bacterium]|nr:molecular chaperone DnaK [Myxococcaceae bacterium]
MATSRGPIIGIDLGTTNSVAAVVQSGHPIIIPSQSGARLTPSVVAVSRDGRQLVGDLAKRQAITNPEGTIEAVKRLIGRRFSAPEVQRTRKERGYIIKEGLHDDIRIPFGGVDASVPELSAMVLAALKADAEAFLEQPVHEAVITVPAYFNDAQRQATKDAGRIAGLDVLRIINEPTAAALAYGTSRRHQGRVLVFDFGGGTFDVSLLEMDAGVFEVLATGGDSFLGGEDLDRRIIGWLHEQLAAQVGMDLREDPLVSQRLRDAAERAKIELSSAQEAQINLPFLYAPRGSGSAVHFQRALSRELLETLTADLVDRTLGVVDRVLADAKLRPNQLHDVLLVGGQTRMPRLQERVRRHLGREPSKGVHPDEVVALGAAIHAHSLGFGGEQVTLLDVTSMSLGVAIAGGFTRRLIPRNTTVPTATTEAFTTSRDGQTTVRIVVLQGESEQAARNELLGSFELSSLRPALRGEVQIDVTFEIDSEGIVSVTAMDRETGASQEITVAASGGLTPEELEAILRQKHAQLSPVRGEGELELRRSELQRAMQEADALLLQVRSLTGRLSTSGSLRQAAAMIEQAQQLIEGEPPLAQVVTTLEDVQRLARSLRSMLHTGS